MNGCTVCKAAWPSSFSPTVESGLKVHSDIKFFLYNTRNFSCPCCHNDVDYIYTLGTIYRWCSS
jgi:hypothetical protein